MRALLISLSIYSATGAFAADRRHFQAPDHRYLATVVEKGNGSEIFIGQSHGLSIFSKKFIAEPGRARATVEHAEWTPDSQFFVIKVRESEANTTGRTLFWSREDKRLHSMDKIAGALVGDFTVSAPDVFHGRVFHKDIPPTEFSISLRKAAKKQPNHPARADGGQEEH